jgi:hypothetical protein
LAYVGLSWVQLAFAKRRMWFGASGLALLDWLMCFGAFGLATTAARPRLHAGTTSATAGPAVFALDSSTLVDELVIRPCFKGMNKCIQLSFQ